MDKQAVIRRVRIAVSLFFGVLTVALCVLWVRSYFASDYFKRVDTHTTTIGYTRSIVNFVRIRHPTAPSPTRPRYDWVLNNEDVFRQISILRGQWTSNIKSIRTPFLLPVVLFAVAAAVPWIQRFSLRTMLTATTLVAVVLALGAWLAS